ncbi:Calnexin [Fulvia fulva]|uniref:Calnexin n=1 Tax=Passalora fulva TaxID=5499 RepID=A0A9Q8LCD6_PASFU|nr:Calnexin [Fulvia fulva]KAK4628765.1 Calnexin [Fulvia fulva]KAK4630682.1 Calnexin [Fulvia fulva]UJO14801.1 Calnexin [Fulvia fulva]WPV12217.1 Calnexin [Fulvia fulva]WPV27190.1 Calnexin [Fulvia fulva]
MRAASLLALGCAASVYAQDDAESADASASIEALLPEFTPTSLKAPFLEQFTEHWESRWKVSHAKKEKTEEEWQYVGTWQVEEPSVLKGIKGDKGLVLKDKAAHHAISAKFDKPIDSKGKDLVLQYEVKLQNFLECGGAYMKLLQDNAALKSDEFTNASPYIIMFGPDKCGSTNKVHFIFRHKNPVTGEYEEKHMNNAPSAEINKLTNLYTLIVKPDQTFELLINNESSKNGSLLEDFTPPVNPSKEIDDAEDKKPEDWIDEKKIRDPEAKKPEDWDEDAPYEIVDEEATKPEDWLDSEPLTIPDPEAEKPEDWDDEEDGDWVAPQVSNPKCDEVSGCGPWEKPMIKNPAYKGKWNAPLIDNPAYKGEWAPRKIANPAFFEDKTPANFEPMGAIGFELWSMNENILFDNIYIGHSIDDAKAFRKETFDVKKPKEKEVEQIEKPVKEEPKKSPMDLVFMDDPVLYIKEKTALFIELAQKNPIDAIKFVPEVAATIGLGLVAILVLLFGAGASAAPSQEEIKAKAEQAKKQAQKTKEEVAKAVASGTDAAKEEINKRTTRSNAQ